MNGVWRTLKAARIEWILLVAAVAVAALFCMSMGSRDGGESGVEERLEYVLSAIEGAGRVRVMVNEEGGAITGVLVVAEGADRVSVVFSITGAVQTLLGLESGQVEVVKMDPETGG